MSGAAITATSLRRELTELWIVRHAQSDGNLGGYVTGQMDVPLTATGHQQAQRVAKRLAGMSFAALYASDLQRATATAGYLSAAVALPILIDPRLRELDAGTWTGMTGAVIAEKFPEEWAAWQLRNPDMRRGGGIGESYNMGALRITQALTDIAERHHGERILVVCHGGVMGLYLSYMMGLDRAHTWHLVVSNTGINRVRPFAVAVNGEPKRYGHIMSVNDLAHLEQDTGIADHQ
ncbi:MAG: histidine phosphatase family protein [Planctomycetes bacterium]|nr:histidine phosphatase family protein [Planctomycetota bacterium]